MSKQTQPSSRRTPWHDVILVCRKCGKKLKGGFGEKRKDTFKSDFQQALKQAGRRHGVRLIEIPCLGVCPKNAVIAFNASHPETIHIIPAGTDGKTMMGTLLGDLQPVTGINRIESA